MEVGGVSLPAWLPGLPFQSPDLHCSGPPSRFANIRVSSIMRAKCSTNQPFPGIPLSRAGCTVHHWCKGRVTWKVVGAGDEAQSRCQGLKAPRCQGPASALLAQVSLLSLPHSNPIVPSWCMVLHEEPPGQKLSLSRILTVQKSFLAFGETQLAFQGLRNLL